MRAYSLDLRERIATALQEGGKEKDIAARFDVSVSTVQRLDRRLRRQETIAPKPPLGRRPQMNGEDQAAFAAMLTERTDWTMQSMAAAWQERTGLLLPKSTLHDLLQRIGRRFKKRVGRPPKETRSSEQTSGNG